MSRERLKMVVAGLSAVCALVTVLAMVALLLHLWAMGPEVINPQVWLASLAVAFVMIATRLSRAA